MTMRIYVGTYAKYNAGNLFGKWLDLEDYDDKDDFYEACAELHSDEEDPEFMFQDWEGIPSDMVGESWIAPETWELMEAFDNHDEDAVRAYMKCFGEWDERDFQDRYRGEYNSWRDFAEELLEETGEIDSIPGHLQCYFDYDAFARDLRDEFCEEDGHFFYKN